MDHDQVLIEDSQEPTDFQAPVHDLIDELEHDDSDSKRNAKQSPPDLEEADERTERYARRMKRYSVFYIKDLKEKAIKDCTKEHSVRAASPRAQSLYRSKMTAASKMGSLETNRTGAATVQF